MSAFVPGYQHDIFVSYAHVDDLTYPGVDAGWVATLISGLKVKLSQKLGRSDLFSLWKDEQLSPHKPLTPEILNALKQSATLVIILSPGYKASHWCLQEMETFWQELTQRTNSDSRIFVVERDKLETGQKPKALEELLGYQFWVNDREGKSLRILGDPIPDPHERLYYDKLGDLANDLANELLRLQTQAAQPIATISKPDTRPTVFLAEVTDDLEVQRDRVHR
uniref:toll/interleukin-1 receptor domain-containing protein n=1 Tax=Crenothrix polyspora TaxID=360316 RepID=UPI0011785193